MKKENITKAIKIGLDGQKEEKVIYGLEDGEERYYGLLGTATGINFGHCFSLGVKYKKDFQEKVFAYRITPKSEQVYLLERIFRKEYVSVEFYELG